MRSVIMHRKKGFFVAEPTALHNVPPCATSREGRSPRADPKDLPAMAANDDDGRSPDAFVRIDAQWAAILEDALIDALQRYDAIHSAWAREHPALAERTRGRQGCDRRFGRLTVQ